MKITRERSSSSSIKLFEAAEHLLLKHYFLISVALVLINFLGCVLIIKRIDYTEVDWKAYMDEVAGVVEYGQFDYKQLRGDTGPLVYPAGFVYLFSILFYVTDHGRNILIAQYVFAVFYSSTLAILLAIYRKSHSDVYDRQIPRFPIYIVGFLFLSRRVISLFVLRLFNDCVQTMLLYIAVLLFMHNQWSFGCLMFTLSVSVKMNALLYAPGLAVLLCQARGFGGFLRRSIGICFLVQIVLGFPFLLHAPVSYLSRAFELTREFLHEWSVNGAFLSEQAFLDKKLAVGLLCVHLITLLLFAHYRWTSGLDGGLLGLILPHVIDRRTIMHHMFGEKSRNLRALHVAIVLFTSNFIGVTFARTLHYQFYTWYAHTIPFLLWGGPYPVALKILILVTIESVFNAFPPSAAPAVALNLCHMVLLLSLWTESKANRDSIFEKSNNLKVD